MASGEEPTDANPVYPEEEDLLEDVDIEEDDDDRSDSTSDHHRLRHVTSPQVTIAIRSVGAADLKPADTPVKKSAADESRKLFQRLWTDEDEIELLQGFLEYTANRCGPHDTTAFYDQIKTKFQLDFNKNQLVEKLRRLKKKYRNVVNKFGSGKDHAFKTPHDQATFEIATKIWGNPNPNSAPANAGHGSDDDMNVIGNPNFGECQSPNFNTIDHVNSTKMPRPKKRNHAGTIKFEEKQQQFVPAVASMNNYNSNYNSDNIINNNNTNNTQQMPMATPVSSVIEETVKRCLTPVLKELLGSSVGANVNGSCCGQGFHGFGRDLMMPFGFFGRDAIAKDDRWKKQQILELEVLSKRLELVQDQIKEQLNELRYATN